MSFAAVERTIAAYATRGYRVRTGLSPWHFNCNAHRSLPLSSVFRDGTRLGTGGGIGLIEMFFFEALSAAWRPTRIFVVGNAFGLSGVLLAVANPAARVVAIDAGVEGLDNAEGTALTRRIAREEGLNLEVVEGFSPGDVAAVVRERLEGRIDLAFIDGLHTDRQQELDFEACWRHGGEHAIYCLHDVLSYRMTASFDRLTAAHAGMGHTVLWRTVSGMGVVYPPGAGPEVARVIDLFTEPADLIGRTRREVAVDWLTRMPGAARLARVLPDAVARAARRLLFGS